MYATVMSQAESSGKILAVHCLCNVESLYQIDNNFDELYIRLNLVDTIFTVTGK